MNRERKSPIDNARQLGKSITDSLEFRNLLEQEEKIYANTDALKLFNKIKNGEVKQNMSENNNLVLEYFKLEKVYKDLIKSVFNVIEYYIEEYTPSSGCKGCNSDCKKCTKGEK